MRARGSVMLARHRRGEDQRHPGSDDRRQGPEVAPKIQSTSNTPRRLVLASPGPDVVIGRWSSHHIFASEQRPVREQRAMMRRRLLLSM